MNFLKTDLLAPLQKILDDILNFMPTVAGFFAFIIVAWLFIKVFLYLVKKILAKTNIDKWSKKLSETKIFGDTTINIVLTKVIVETTRWFLILFTVMLGAEIFEMQSVSQGIQSFFAYLPKLISAIAIFVGGVYLGTIVKKAIQSTFKSLDLSGGNLVGNILFYIIVIFLTITALEQAGIDTSIIKNNITLLLGSILIAFTIAFGLGARDAVSRLLFGYYSRKNIAIGTKIKIDDIEGMVTAIDNISLTISTEDATIVLPINQVVDSKIIIKK